MSKTKEEILLMTREELHNYKWSKDLDKEKINNNCDHCYNCNYCNDCDHCDNCNDCRNCDNCDDCRNCDDCYDCRNCDDMKYAICNIELSEKEYKNKINKLRRQ